MRTSSSALRPAPVSDTLRTAFLTLFLVLAGPATAQLPSPVPAQQGAVVVVDMQRVLRDAAAAEALRRIEREEGATLRNDLDSLTAAFEEEEAELTRLRDERDRGQFDRDDFDRRVQDFDRRVRLARQQAQEGSVAFQNRFAEAFAALERQVGPVIAELMAARGAAVALDTRRTLYATQAVNITSAVIERLDAVLPASLARTLLPPVPAPR